MPGGPPPYPMTCSWIKGFYHRRSDGPARSRGRHRRPCRSANESIDGRRTADPAQRAFLELGPPVQLGPERSGLRAFDQWSGQAARSSRAGPGDLKGFKNTIDPPVRSAVQVFPKAVEYARYITSGQLHPFRAAFSPCPQDRSQVVACHDPIKDHQVEEPLIWLGI